LLAGASPSQEFEFLVFEGIGGFKKLLQLVHGSRRKSPDVCKSPSKGGPIRYRENSIVPLFVAL